MSKLTTKVKNVSKELFELCQSKNIEDFEHFIKKNKGQIDINFADENGKTLLIKLCSEYFGYSKAFDIIKLLIDNFKEQIDINLYR